MKRGWAICRAGHWNSATAADRVRLEPGERRLQRITLQGERGTAFLLDLDEAVTLRDGDGIVLDDGSVVTIAGRAERLLEFGMRTPRAAALLAWRLGSSHVPMQIAGDRLRIRHDPAWAEEAARLGATVTEIDAPFDAGAAASGHGHSRHDHDHGDHDHRHDHDH